MSDPLYKIDRASRSIRVFHGDIVQSWWRRGNSLYEREAKEIEAVIRRSTGLQRIYRRHEGCWVVFVLKARHFDSAAVAVRMEFRNQFN